MVWFYLFYAKESSTGINIWSQVIEQRIEARHDYLDK